MSVRVFGGALCFAQDFRSPMAKQHRMAVLTAGCLLVLSSIVTWILWIRLVKEQAEPKGVATIANLAARVKAWLEMEGKDVGAMPGIEQHKNLRHILLSRRARVAGDVGISSAECPAIEAISVYPGPESLQCEQPGGGRNRCVSDKNEERSETIGAAGNTPKCEGLAVRESEIRHGEFCVDQFQDLSANFVHRDIEHFADGMQFGELIRRRGKQDFFELLVGIFHHRRPFHYNGVNRFR